MGIVREILLELVVLKHMRLRGIQVGEGMGIWAGATRTTRTTRTNCPSARGHARHHRARLADLGSSRRRHTRMHLLYHSSAGVSVWMLRGHWVIGGKPMLRHALVGRKRLRHHHC